MNGHKKSWLERLTQLLTGSEEPSNREELMEVLEEAEDKHLLKTDALNMIKGVMQVAELTVDDIMVPRSQVIVIPINAPLPDILSIIIESGHSRFPVVDKSLDDVKGLLLAKDLLQYNRAPTEKPFSLNNLLRSITLVPESKHLDVLLREFRHKHHHLALATDEYGNISGLVTIEDILEEIVGEIEDEYDTEENETHHITKTTNNQYIVDALTTIDDFNRFFSADLASEDFDTIGGLITRQFDHLPTEKESLTVDGFHFTVTKADNRKIRKLRVKALTHKKNKTVDR
jgi:magnesium and cobalt transporter